MWGEWGEVSFGGLHQMIIRDKYMIIFKTSHISLFDPWCKWLYFTGIMLEMDDDST